MSGKIIIVGAGASGLAAATRLYENGFKDITILEAENRIGGRICSVDFDGVVADIGGQWVHGEKGNIVFEMVKDLDLISPSKLSENPGMLFFLIDGTAADQTLTDRLLKLAMAVMEDKINTKKHGGSFAEYFHFEYNKRIRKEFSSKELEAFRLAHSMMEEWFKKFIILLNPAESWEQLSTTSPYVFQPCEGHQMYGWRNKGYKTILDVITKTIPDPSKELPIKHKVILNKEVTKILWQDNVKVECSDGSLYCGDHVILTVSVGVLKNLHKNAFVPSLPSFKVNSIEGIPLGVVNKVLLKFPKKWWPDNIRDISFLWSEDQRDEIIKEFPKEELFNGRVWVENIFSLTSIDSHPNILLAWINGPTARFVEQLSDERVLAGLMFILRKFAGQLFDIPEPEGLIRSKWGTNPHFRGSYVYVSADMEKRQASAHDLSTPLEVNGKPIVLFAGEATHASRFSTVNGAMETGYREADRLINFYSKNAK
ncbi:hypothetical protein ABEB36_013516 [Hypothenemus hampei]|uniref:Amine oxidase domain-containing protein n=1 Tax=Hypothenemus hampei TaxID=57062 RepID=A0ABD1E4E4_HYPHA